MRSVWHFMSLVIWLQDVFFLRFVPDITLREYDVWNLLGTSAAPCKGVIYLSWTAQRLDPVWVVLLVLDHSTDVDQLKGALVQQCVCVGWNRTVTKSQPKKLAKSTVIVRAERSRMWYMKYEGSTTSLWDFFT